MATESTAAELQTYLSTNFVSGTGSFKLATLKTYLENLNASILIALQKTYFEVLTGSKSTTISFVTPFAAGSTYQLTWWAFDASGNPVTGCKITALTVNGFTVFPVADCTFHYHVVKNN